MSKRIFGLGQVSRIVIDPDPRIGGGIEPVGHQPLTVSEKSNGVIPSICHCRESPVAVIGHAGLLLIQAIGDRQKIALG